MADGPTYDDEIALGEKTLSRLETERELLKVKLAAGQATQAEIDAQDDLIKKQQESLVLLKQAMANLETLSANLATNIKKLSGIDMKWENTPFGSMLLGIFGKGGASMGDAFKNLGGFQKLLSGFFFSIGTKIAESTVLLTFMFDEAITGFNASTGAAGMFNDAIIDTSMSLLSENRSIQDVVESFQTLFLETTNFRNLTQAQQKDLASFTNQLNLLGVENQHVAALYQDSTRTFGMSNDAAKVAMEGVRDAALNNKISVGAFAGEVALAVPKLAFLGTGAFDAAKKMAVLAKNTGLSVDSILAFNESVQTITGAAGVGGKLNAILGGNVVNSMDLLKASFEGGDKALLHLRNSMKRFGITWESMHPAKQVVLAKEMGFSVQEMARLMNDPNLGKNVATLIDPAQLERATEASKNFKKAMMNFVLAFGVPLANFVNKTLTPAINWLTAAIQDLSGGWKAFIMVFSLAMALLIGVGAKKIFVKAGESIGSFFGAIGKGAGTPNAARGLLVLGAAFLMFGAAIAIAAWGVSKLATAMGEMNGNAGAFVGALAIIIGGFIAMALLGKALAVGGLLAAVGIIAIGAAFAVAAFGVASFMDPFNLFFENFEKFMAIDISSGIKDKLMDVGEGLRVVVDAVDAGSFFKMAATTALLKRAVDVNVGGKQDMSLKGTIKLEAPIEIKIGNEVIKKIVTKELGIDAKNFRAAMGKN